MALGSSVYKLVFDTQGIENVTVSRRELALKKTIMEETATAADKLTVAESNLDRMVKKDLISIEQKNAVLQKIRDEQNAASGSSQNQLDSLKRLSMAHASGIPLVGQLVAGFESFGPAGVVATAAFMGIATAANVVSGAIHTTIDNVSEQIDKIDKLIAVSETINVPVDQFQRLSHAADLANVSEDALSNSMEKMLINISKAADGTSKKLAPAFALAGVDAKKLRDMQPEQAFLAITKALDTIPNAADRARTARDILGSPELLRVNTEHIERANKLMEQLRPVLDEVTATTFSEFDSSVKDMNMALAVTWQKLAMEIVPALTDAAKVATEWLVDVNNNETFTDTLTEIGDALTIIAAIAREFPHVVDEWTPSLDTFLNMLKTANPKLAVALELVDAGGGAVDDATSDIADQARRQRELNAKLKAAQKSGEPVGGADEDVSPIERETKAIQDLIDKLKEEVATKGMSTAMAKVWKLEQLGAGTELIAKNRELAAEFDQITKAEKASKAVEAFTESLRLQGESAETSARRLADLKLAHDGVDEATRKSLMTQFDASEAQKTAIETQKKAAAAAKQHADAVVTLGENVQKEEAKLRGYTSAIGDNEARMRASERAALEWQLTNDKADAATKTATLSIFDQSTALEKRVKATQSAIDIQEELTKKIRQTFMTESEKKLDDAKIAGVSDEELKVIEALQKQLSLREDILKSQNASVLAIKRGSQEEAELILQAQRRAVLANLQRQTKDTSAGVSHAVPKPALPERSEIGMADTGAPVRSPADERAHAALEKHSSALGDFAATVDKWIASASLSPVASTTDTWKEGEKWRDTPDREAFYNRLGEGLATAAIRAFERRSEIARDLSTKRSLDTERATEVREEIARESVKPSSLIPKTPIVQKSPDELRELQKSNGYLSALVNKSAVTITVEEVTL